MVRFVRRYLIFYGTLFFVFTILSCSDQQADVSNDFIIKTSLVSITGLDFSEELDLKRAAYPYNIKDSSTKYNKMVIHLVKMLSEEIILLSAAKDAGITVGDAELNAALKEFKKDYPEDSFKQILLKNAVSYPLWLSRFKKNMVMDKLISRQLRKKIEITSQDIVEFYKRFQQNNVQSLDDSASVLDKIDNEKELVSRLRMHKTQEQYEDWIQQLANKYPVKINKEKLKTFLINIEKDKETKNEN